MKMFHRCHLYKQYDVLQTFGDIVAFSIRLTEAEDRLARSYAVLHGISVGEAFRNALFEKIEDEYYISVADVAYGKYLETPKSYSHDEVLKMFGDDE